MTKNQTSRTQLLNSHFTDLDGQACLLEDTELPDTTPAVWLGVRSRQMLLGVKAVRALILALEGWLGVVEHGKISGSPAAGESVKHFTRHTQSGDMEIAAEAHRPGTIYGGARVSDDPPWPATATLTRGQVVASVRQASIERNHALRFVMADPQPEGSGADTTWWLDTWRMAPPGGDYRYVLVEVKADIDANNYVRHDNLYILYTDQVEFCFVCLSCYDAFKHMQWSGSTLGPQDWPKRAEARLKIHKAHKAWCEFCDPVFGNGGWRHNV